MPLLNQPGTFKAMPMGWDISKKDDSKSVAMVIQFHILEALGDDNQWQDWREYQPQEITGYFYVVKKDGNINTVQVEQLAKAIGWNGDISLGTLRNGPPEKACQIVVEWEEYNGKDRLKIKWINPEDYTPGLKQSDDSTVQNVAAVYGSQLRAAAAQHLPRAQPAAKKAAPPAKPKPATVQEAPDEDLPF